MASTTDYYNVVSIFRCRIAPSRDPMAVTVQSLANQIAE